MNNSATSQNISKNWWTLKRRLIFVFLTLLPLLFFYSMQASDYVFHYSAQSASFSFIEFIFYSWLEFGAKMDLANTGLFLASIAIVYIYWWRKPTFLKSYSIALLVIIICGFFSKSVLRSPMGYYETLMYYPDFIHVLPGWFKFLLDIWPA